MVMTGGTGISGAIGSPSGTWPNLASARVMSAFSVTDKELPSRYCRSARSVTAPSAPSDTKKLKAARDHCEFDEISAVADDGAATPPSVAVYAPTAPTPPTPTPASGPAATSTGSLLLLREREYTINASEPPTTATHAPRGSGPTCLPRSGISTTGHPKR